MEKIITIDNRQVKFKSTGAFLLRYKAQFHRDAIKDIYRLQGAVEVVEETIVDDETGEERIVKKNIIKDIEALDLEVFYNLVWTLAKTADPTILTPMEWLDTFSEFPLYDILPELMHMIFSSFNTTIESKKKI